MKKKILSLLLALTLLGTTAVFGDTASNPLSINAEAASTGKLRKPDGLSAKVKGMKITLSWQEVDGAEAYGVYMYNASRKKYVKVKNTAKTEITVTTKKEGTYKFRVYSLDKSGKKYKKGNYAFRAAKVVVDRLETEFKGIKLGMTKKQVLMEIDGSDYTVSDDGLIIRTIVEDYEYAIYYFENNRLYNYGFAYELSTEKFKECCDYLEERGWIMYGTNYEGAVDELRAYYKGEDYAMVKEDNQNNLLYCLIFPN